MRVVFLGPPGAGKGTQAVRLAAARGIPHISTGNMLREAAASGSAIGREAKGYMDRGTLVPDEVVIRAVEERLSRPDAAAGFLLDGYPRTVPQAQALDAVLARARARLDRVYYFATPEDVVVRRLSGRRTCSNKSCAAVYHLQTLRPKKQGVCDTCGSPLEGRADDDEERVKTRLSVYHKQTTPLIAYYQRQGTLKPVEGAMDIEPLLAVIQADLATVGEKAHA